MRISGGWEESHTPGPKKEDKRQVQSSSNSTNRRWSLFYGPGAPAKKDMGVLLPANHPASQPAS